MCWTWGRRVWDTALNSWGQLPLLCPPQTHCAPPACAGGLTWEAEMALAWYKFSNHVEMDTTGSSTSLLLKGFSHLSSVYSTQLWLLLSFFAGSFLLHDWLTPTCLLPNHLTLHIPHTASSDLICPLHDHLSLTSPQPAAAMLNTAEQPLILKLPL